MLPHLSLEQTPKQIRKGTQRRAPKLGHAQIKLFSNEAPRNSKPLTPSARMRVEGLSFKGAEEERKDTVFERLASSAQAPSVNMLKRHLSSSTAQVQSDQLVQSDEWKLSGYIENAHVGQVCCVASQQN